MNSKKKDTLKDRKPLSMNKAFYLKKEERQPQWRLIDAQGKILGRLATEIADALRGKDKPIYTPHIDAGDYVVVINAEKITMTGDKMEEKIYKRFSGWIGGLKELTARQVMEKDPTRIIDHAVKGMLPKSKLGRHMFRKLKVYAGPEHPHKAQVSTKLS